MVSAAVFFFLFLMVFVCWFSLFDGVLSGCFESGERDEIGFSQLLKSKN